MCLHVCTGMYVRYMHTCIHSCVSWCLYTHDWWTILMRQVTVGHEMKTRLGPVCADMGSFLISAIMAGHNTKSKVRLPFLNNPTSLLTQLIQCQLPWWQDPASQSVSYFGDLSHKYCQEGSITSLPTCTQQIKNKIKAHLCQHVAALLQQGDGRVAQAGGQLHPQQLFTLVGVAQYRMQHGHRSKPVGHGVPAEQASAQQLARRDGVGCNIRRGPWSNHKAASLHLPPGNTVWG